MNKNSLIKISDNVSKINKMLKLSSLVSKIIKIITISVIVISAADSLRTLKRV